MIFLFSAIVSYLLLYWGNSDPPIRDPVSPTIILNLIIDMALMYPRSYRSLCVIIGLTFDGMADYLMDTNKIELPIVLFLIGHIIKQFILTNGSITWIHILSLIVTSYFITSYILMKFYNSNNRHRRFNMIPGYAIGFYSIIMFLTFLINPTNRGFILFIISDLIIACDLLVNRIYPRQLRTMIVPILFWAAEYTFAHDIMNS